MKLIIRIIYITAFFTSIVISAQALQASVEIKGKRADIDLSDLISLTGMKFTETEIKKLCVRITERYHDLGYSGFFIREARLKKSGNLELIFCDPVVENIIIRGDGFDHNPDTERIYRKGSVFNEYLLKDNIGLFKKMYNVKNLSVDLKRTAGDDIEITVNVKRDVVHGDILAASEPVYGAYARLDLSIDSDPSGLRGFFEYADGLEQGEYKKGGLNYLYSINGGSFSIYAGMSISESNEYLDNNSESIYSVNEAEGEAGMIILNRACRTVLSLFSSYAVYEGYNKTEGGPVFSGILLQLIYNDQQYRVDPLDTFTAGIFCRYGWNYIEDDPEARVGMYGDMSLPLAGIFAFTAGILSAFTTEDMRIFHGYVYDREMPCRSGDYTTAQWKGVARIGLRAGIYDRLFYFSPEFIYGAYNKKGGVKSVYAFGAGISFIMENVRSEASYTVEAGESIKQGVITVSAGASF